MSTYKRSLHGFCIKVATGAIEGEGILLTDADLASMGGVKSLVAALRKTFKDQLGPAVLIDGAVFLAYHSKSKSLPSLPGRMPRSYSPDSPLRHTQAPPLRQATVRAWSKYRATP